MNIPLTQPTHHAIGGAQAQRRAAGEKNRVDPLDEMTRIHDVELACAGGAPAHADRGSQSRLRGENHGAARAMIFHGRMPDGDAGDRCEIRS